MGYPFEIWPPNPLSGSASGLNPMRNMKLGEGGYGAARSQAKVLAGTLEKCLGKAPWKKSYETKVTSMQRSQGGGRAGRREQDTVVQDRSRRWAWRGRAGRAGAG